MLARAKPGQHRCAGCEKLAFCIRPAKRSHCRSTASPTCGALLATALRVWLCGVCAGISTLPPGLGELRDLEGLQAEGCPLLPPYANLYSKDPLLLVALHDRERLSLDLSDCGLSEVPADLQQQTQLTCLNLGKNNYITDLPTWLGNLRRLRQLTVKGNPLQQPFARCGLCCRPPSHPCCARLHNEPRGEGVECHPATRPQGLSASMRCQCLPAALLYARTD